ncbi:MAG: YggT family protein [Candidatus Omnitrophica bacterium]|nr:YggT family protein [Candidatus Omnitrophota bacterium]MDD4941360.1 YggT family protein [Candidatus Omnitrophota bacterium]MDD5774526.1 YggT family protein [Candidatus Omnitrophota bacterium]HNQ50609.1 YggT family protein [Candidatus Omnitrophota bacterium]HQO38569.1 YggT family protein [Candidatus Omnitrophota bacterium]
MFIIVNFLEALGRILDIGINIYVLLIVFRAVISWVNADPHNPIVQFLQKATDPLLVPIRKFLPFSWKWSIDVSPVIAILLLIFVQSFLVRTLFDIARRLG